MNTRILFLTTANEQFMKANIQTHDTTSMHYHYVGIYRDELYTQRHMEDVNSAIEQFNRSYDTLQQNNQPCLVVSVFIASKEFKNNIQHHITSL